MLPGFVHTVKPTELNQTLPYGTGWVNHGNKLPYKFWILHLAKNWGQNLWTYFRRRPNSMLTLRANISGVKLDIDNREAGWKLRRVSYTVPKFHELGPLTAKRWRGSVVRTSVLGRRTFPVLRSTCSGWVTTNVGKPSATGGRYRSTNQANSAFRPFGVDKWVASCNQMSGTSFRSGNLWWMLTGRRPCVAVGAVVCLLAAYCAAAPSALADQLPLQRL